MPQAPRQFRPQCYLQKLHSRGHPSREQKGWLGQARQEVQELTMGTETPPSFCVPDVAAWLCARGYGLGCESVGFGRDGLGSVSIGRLRWGRQGPAARQLVQDGYQEVRVDRHSSRVGNPFCGASASKLCRAYDELMRAVLVTPLTLDEDLQHFQDPRHDAMAGQRPPAPWEQSLLHAIAEKHEVLLHRQHVRPSDVRAWLVHYASLLLQGTSLTLHCWCFHGEESPEPWVCHAQSLRGALLWVATTLRVQLSAAGRCHPAEPDGPQVNAFSSSFQLAALGLLRAAFPYGLSSNQSLLSSLWLSSLHAVCAFKLFFGPRCL